jgi:hypothetical protein
MNWIDLAADYAEVTYMAKLFVRSTDYKVVPEVFLQNAKARSYSDLLYFFTVLLTASTVVMGGLRRMAAIKITRICFAFFRHEFMMLTLNPNRKFARSHS